jgi:hypothetical protein
VPGYIRPPKVSFLRTGLAATIVVGTLSVPAAAAASAETLYLQPARKIDHTVSVPFAPAPTPRDNVSAGPVLSRLRQDGQLNWGEVSQALGVSRRTIHNWLSGLQIAPTHLQRLRELAALVEVAMTSSSKDIHTTLTVAGPYGRNLLEEFVLQHQPSLRLGARIKVSDLLEPDKSDLRVPPVIQPTRASSLRGGPMRPRQAKP